MPSNSWPPGKRSACPTRSAFRVCLVGRAHRLPNWGDGCPAAAPVTVSAEPVDPPILIPPGGGSFRATVIFTNTTTTSPTFDFFGRHSRALRTGTRFWSALDDARAESNPNSGDSGANSGRQLPYTHKVGTFSSTVSSSDSQRRQAKLFYPVPDRSNSSGKSACRSRCRMRR